MGGAGYIFTGENDANVMHSSALINLNVAQECVKKNIKKIFYSSSACMYPEHNQLDPNNPNCIESSAYPANPDSEYGWEKLIKSKSNKNGKNKILIIPRFVFYTIYSLGNLVKIFVKNFPLTTFRYKNMNMNNIIELKYSIF